jgi:hypothetical protein
VRIDVNHQNETLFQVHASVDAAEEQWKTPVKVASFDLVIDLLIRLSPMQSILIILLLFYYILYNFNYYFII